MKEFEKLFSLQLRHPENFRSAKSIQPYYDTKEVLNLLKPFASETCLCTRDHYRLNINRLGNAERQEGSPSPAASLNAIKGLNFKSSVDDFVHLASECYDKCINVFLNNLNDCNRRAEIIERQSLKLPTVYSGRSSLRSKKINDLHLANRINQLNINLDACQRPSPSCSPENFFSARQSTLSLPACSKQTMNCSDANNNSTESTNQLKDPPKIILSDHSTNQTTLQGDIKTEFSDSKRNSVDDKNSLTIPIENFYSSEARPP